MAFAPPKALFDEITDFLATAPTQEQIIAFKPSIYLTHRMQELLDKNSRDELTSDERNELDEFLRMNHLLKMIRLKARMKQIGGKK